VAVRHCFKVRHKPLAIVAIPKVAASSILAVSEVEPEPCLAHEARANGWFVAAFVRHPLDRLVSAWADKSRAMTPGLLHCGFEADMSFDDFVTHVAQHDDDDHHLRQQYRFIVHRGRLSVDFIGRYERLEDDWGLLRKMFGLQALTHVNPSPRSRDFASYYTAKSRETAENTYRRDLRFLDYR